MNFSEGSYNLFHRDELLRAITYEIRNSKTSSLVDSKIEFLDDNDDVLATFYGALSALNIIVQDIDRDDEHCWNEAVDIKVTLPQENDMPERLDNHKLEVSAILSTLKSKVWDVVREAQNESWCQGYAAAKRELCDSLGVALDDDTSVHEVTAAFTKKLGKPRIDRRRMDWLDKNTRYIQPSVNGVVLIGVNAGVLESLAHVSAVGCADGDMRSMIDEAMSRPNPAVHARPACFGPTLSQHVKDAMERPTVSMDDILRTVKKLSSAVKTMDLKLHDKLAQTPGATETRNDRTLDKTHGVTKGSQS